MRTYAKPVPGLSALRSAAFVELVDGYREKLIRASYSQHVARLHLRSIVCRRNYAEAYSRSRTSSSLGLPARNYRTLSMGGSRE
jgi:hypothetical protein